MPRPDEGWFDHAFFLLSDGSLAVLQTDSDIHTKFQDWNKKPSWMPRRRRMPNPWRGSARLCTISHEGNKETTEFPLVPHPLIDRFPDGRWLLASSRAASDDENGLILEPDGRQSNSFQIGDGIEHIRCASDGTIWVGYFDEGVFGDTSGVGGIVRFDQWGKELWSFNRQEQKEWPFVDDCYALTINNDELWSCYYSDFPIVRLINGRLTKWNNEISGARALAVDGSYVLLAGGYPNNDNRLALLKLERGQANLIGAIERPELEKACLIQGRASTIHAVGEEAWTSITVEEVRSRLR